MIRKRKSLSLHVDVHNFQTIKSEHILMAIEESVFVKDQ